MKYLLLIYGDEAEFAKAAAAGRVPEIIAGHSQLQADLTAQGVEWSASRLTPAATAKTVARQGEGHSLHDGPFAETKEQLGGYYLVDVADVEAALAWARKVPLLDGGKVEVRPVM